MQKPLKVLLVEDTEDDALLVLRELRRGGYDVSAHRVETAEAMEEALAGGVWDVVISDYNLPSFSGPDALRTLKATSLDIPFILVSGAIGEDAAVAVMKAGAHDYLLKDKLTRLPAAVEREIREAEIRLDHRRANEELRAREEELASLYTHAPVVLLLVDRDRRVRKMNETARTVADREPGEAIGMRGGEALRCVSALDDSRGCGYGPACTSCAIRIAVLETFESGRPAHDVEATLTMGPETARAKQTVLVSTSRLNLQEEPFVLVALLDITERKRAEEALLRERDRAETYLRVAGVMFVAMDLDGTVTAINDKGCEILGYSQHEIIGKDWFDVFLTPETREVTQSVTEALLRGDPKSQYHENTVLTRAGRERLVAWHNVPLRDGHDNIVGTLSSGEDVTERRKAEGRYKALFESSQDAVMTLAPPSWRFTSCNPATLRMFGVRDEAEFASRAPWEYSPVHQQDGRPSVEKAREMIETAMRDGAHLFQWTHQRVDGTVFPATVLLTRVRLGDEDLLQATVRDVTESVAMEARLRQSQKLQAVGTLAGGVAHDFNNLLMGIMNYTELCRDGLEADHPVHEWLEEITAVAQRSADLTGQLLAFARKQTIAPKPMDLNDTVGGMLKLLRRLIGEDIDLT